jgi:2-keto-4-pentenoate hydratase/2-oxohepta-3-ene-1,7-dioic acid hydratase in catechol pathway
MKIFGIGMNYRDHAEEMKVKAPGRNVQEDVIYTEPEVFTKCDSALVTRGKPFFIPDYTEECEYEAELVVRICRMGRSISERFAHRYYDAVTVGVDFTARDLQRRLREKGLPWDLAKGFDGSAVIGDFRDFNGESALQLPGASSRNEEHKVAQVLKQGIGFRLDINGKTVQSGISTDMIYSVDQIVSYISRFCTLKTGDLIFTGTPVGVGRVHIDDHITGWLDEEKVLEFNVK